MLDRDYCGEALSHGLPADEPPAPIVSDEPPPPNGPEDYGLANGRANGVMKPPEIPAFLPLSIDEWLDRLLPEPDYLMGHWLTTTSRALMNAATGLGKTMFAMGLGMAVADGTDFLHWRGTNKPARVLYIDGEMSRRLLKKRIAEEVDRRGSIPETFYALSHEDIEGFAPLNTPAGQDCIERIINGLEGVDLIIFDSIMCLTVGEMKGEIAWAQITPWVRRITKEGIGQIWVHHTGHDETRGYGDKTREWQMDTVTHLEGVKREDTDVSFSHQFRKARERTPDTRADFRDVRVALVENRWQHDAVDAQRPGHIAPLAQKFLDALLNVLAGEGTARVGSRKAATTDAWKAECATLGVLDPERNAHSARTLFAKHRRELVAANRVACEGDLSWTL